MSFGRVTLTHMTCPPSPNPVRDRSSPTPLSSFSICSRLGTMMRTPARTSQQATGVEAQQVTLPHTITTSIHSHSASITHSISSSVSHYSIKAATSGMDSTDPEAGGDKGSTVSSNISSTVSIGISSTVSSTQYSSLADHSTATSADSSGMTTGQPPHQHQHQQQQGTGLLLMPTALALLTPDHLDLGVGSRVAASSVKILKGTYMGGTVQLFCMRHHIKINY